MSSYKLATSAIALITAVGFSTPTLAGPFDGFYVGGQLDYTHGNQEVDDSVAGIPPLGIEADLGSEGFGGGIFAGWGTRFSSDWYGGVEFQYNELGNDGDISLTGLGSIDWEADNQWGISGRLGYMLSNDTMVFGRLGYVERESDYGLSLGIPFSLDGDDADGYEFGLGVEHRISGNWTLRGEYIYTQYDDADIDLQTPGPSFTVAETDASTSSLRIGLAYSFGGSSSKYSASSSKSPGKAFDGFYVGGQLDYTHGDQEVSDSVAGIPPLGIEADLGSEGFGGGFLAGWGTRFSSGWYGGVEFQYNELGNDGDISLTGLGSIDWEAESQWGISGRLGYLASSDTMFFARLGYVEREMDYNLAIGIPVISLDGDDADGYEFGFGVEHRISGNWTLRGEYIYTQYDDADIDVQTPGPSFTVAESDASTSSIRFGVAYTF